MMRFWLSSPVKPMHSDRFALSFDPENGVFVLSYQADPEEALRVLKTIQALEGAGVHTPDTKAPESQSDAEAVENLLANLETADSYGDGRGENEPPTLWVALGRPKQGTDIDAAYTRAWRAKERIRDRFNREMRELGRVCRSCEQHFKPANIRFKNCPDCVQARKRGES